MPEVKAIELKMKSGELAEFGAKLMEQIRSSQHGMKGLRDKLERVDNWYESNLPPKDFPWPNCSNVNIPVIQWVVDSYHAHINDVMLGVRPYTLVQPVEPADKEKSRVIEGLLDAVEVGRMRLADSIDPLLLYGLKHGTAIGKLPWREEYRTVKDMVPKMDPFTGLSAPAIDESGLSAPQMEIISTQETKYAGPKLEFVDIHNFTIYPLTAKSIEEAVMVGDRYRLTENQVKARAMSGYFDEKASEAVIAVNSQNEQSRAEGADDEYLNSYEGIDKVNFPEYWFWEVIAPFDSNGDSIEEDCVFTVEATSGTVVRAKEYPYWHGRRCYVAWRPFPRPGRFFGRGLGEILENMQQEINTIHNQRVDATHLAMCKAFKVLRSADLDPDAARIHPGAMIQVDNMDDITEFDINPLVPGLDIEQIARDYAERSSGINDVSLGRQTEGSKTAREVSIVNSEGGIRFGDVIRRLQSPMVEVAEQVIGLMYQFATDQEIMQITGQMGNVLRQTNDPMSGAPVQMITRADLRGSFDFIPHGNTGTANKMQKRQEASFLYEQLMQNPLVQQDPLHVWAVTRDLLTSFDRDDPDEYIGSEQEIQQMKMQQQQQQAMMAQAQQEQQMMQQQAMMQQQQMQEQQGMQQQGQMEQQSRQAEDKQAMEMAKFIAEQENRESDRGLKREEIKSRAKQSKAGKRA